VGVTPSGPVKANRGVRARVSAAGKVLEGDDQRTVSPLYCKCIAEFAVERISIIGQKYLTKS